MKPFVLLCLCAAVLAQAPYPASTYITGMTWDWSSHKRGASGADNWAVTWAGDDAQYAAWGDGWGFHSTLLSGAKVSLGVSKITGSFDSYTTQDLWGIPASGQGGKSYGILSIASVLYMWYGPGSNTTSYDWTRLKRSADHGVTWADASWQFNESSDLVMPAICNFGRDYAGARDNYVYSYFIRLQGSPSSLNVHKPGMIDLARVPKDRMMTQGVYEWVTGFDVGGNPAWGSDYNNRVAVFEDPNGVGWCFSVSYNSGLGRYLLVTEHTSSFNANLGFFEAPEPWGPWKTVEYYTGWGSGSGISDVNNTFFANFSNKWTSSDGKNTVLVFSGTNDMDSYNAVRCGFAVQGTGVRAQARRDDGAGLSVFPNPVNAEAKIAAIGQRLADSDIGIAIYDIKGRMIHTLSAAGYQLSAGITWNASSLPSGLYVVRARLGNRVYSRTLVLQK